MGRHKFEDQFKDKLSKREITPSAGGWDKLSGQLNSEGEKPKPLFWWIGIAATLLGAIFIAGLIYNNNPETNNPGLVETPVKIESEDKNESFEEGNGFVPEEVIVEASPKKADTSTLLKEKASQSQQLKHAPENSIIAEVEKESLPVSNENVIVVNDEKISRKLEEIIAEVSMKDGVAGDRTNDEIEALLFKAASEISQEKRSISYAGTVDSRDLLFAIEMELEETFREKVFDILKESYLKARTAVANRSY